MENTLINTTILSADNSANGRFDELIAQFNHWIADQTSDSISLCFTTSDEHPLLIGEVSRFFKECPYFDDSRTVEWDFATNPELGARVQLCIKTIV